MDVKRMDELNDLNRTIEMEDYYSQKKIWEEMYSLLTENLEDTMDYLNKISKEDIWYTCSVFEDISEYFQSQELITCMEKAAIRTGVDCDIDIQCAKEMLK